MMSLRYRAAKCCANCDRLKGAWCEVAKSIVAKSAVCNLFKMRKE